MRRTIPTDPADRVLYLLVAFVAATGLVVLAAAVADLTGLFGTMVPAPRWQWLLAYTLLVVIAQRLVVNVRIRSSRQGWSWADAAVVVGLSLLPVSWVVVTAGAGTLLARLLVRSPASRQVFAVGKVMILTAIAGLVFTGLRSVTGEGIGWQVLCLLAAFAVMTSVDMLLTPTAVALSSRTPLADRLWRHLDIELLALAGRMLVTTLAVLALYRAPQLIYPLPLLVLLAYVWHEHWVRSREERRAWQELALATASFSEAALDTVLRQAALGGARLFSAELGEVELRHPPPGRLVRGSADEVRYDGDPADAPPEPELGEVHELRLHGCPARPDIGALRLRFRNRVRLSEREHAMLATYVAALESAVRTATSATSDGELRHTP